MKIILFSITMLAITLSTAPIIAEPVHVYFGSRNNIYFSLFDTDKGELSLPKPVLEIENPGFIVIHPNKKFLYTTTTGIQGSKDGGVAALKINNDGTLTLINKQSSEGKNPCHVNIDATGNCLMVVNYSSGSVTSYKINHDGSLQKAIVIHQHKGSVPNSSRQESPHPHSIFPNPNNNFAYVPDLGLDKIMIYKIEHNASLKNIGFSKIPGSNMGPRHMKWSKNGKYAYILNELMPKLTIFKAIDDSGKLEYIDSISTLDDNTDPKDMYGSEIRIHPNGKFIYAAMRDTSYRKRDLIAVFNTLENGNKVRRIAITPAEVSIPRNFNITPGGKWMLIAGRKSHDIAIFGINKKNGLISFTGRKVHFNGEPICIEFLRNS